MGIADSPRPARQAKLPKNASPQPRRVLAALGRSWFYLALATAFGVGWFAPALGHEMDDAGIMPYLVALAFFLNGLTLSAESLLGGLRQWPLLAVGMLQTFLLPLVVVVLAFRVVPGADTPLGIGFIMLAVVPTTLVSAVVLTRLAGGSGAVALYLTVLANLLAIILVPLLMRVVLRNDMSEQIALWATALKLVYTVLLPTVAGQLLRLLIHRWADHRRHALGIISQVTILLFVVNGMAALPRDEISPATWIGVVLGAVLLHVLLLLTAEGSGRLLRGDTPTRRAFTLSTSEKSLAVAVALWTQLFRPLGGLVLLPAIVYYVAQLVIDNVLAHRWGRAAHDA
jgi:sodium/bile acid cotransporter 7